MPLSGPSASPTAPLAEPLGAPDRWPLPPLPRAPRPRAARVVGLRPRHQLAALLADPRQAVLHDSIRCLVCGGSFRQLTNTHLRGHRMTADEYKRRFARSVAQQTAQLVQTNGARNVILVAQKRMLGLLRGEFDALVKNDVSVSTVAKDLSKLTPQEVHRYLAKEQLVPPRKNPGA